MFLKKDLIFGLLISIASISCSGLDLFGEDYYVAKFKFALTSVERPEDAKDRYGNLKIDIYAPDDSSAFTHYFEDNLVKTLFYVAPHGFNFEILNNTEKSIKIIWDEAVYVSPDNMSHRIMHKGTSYDKRENPQAPSVIIRKGFIDDFVVPTDRVYYYTGLSVDPSGWKHYDILDCKDVTEDVADAMAKAYVGKKIQLLLPFEIEGTINDYIFEFTILDYEIVQERIYVGYN